MKVSVKDKNRCRPLQDHLKDRHTEKRNEGRGSQEMYCIKNVKNNIGEKTITIDDLYSTFRKSGILAFKMSATF